MKQSLPTESERQQNNRSHLTLRNTSPISQAFVDNRESSAAQRQLMAKMASSPQATAQRKFSEQIHNSPRMTAQRKQIAKAFGGAVQRVEGEEELMQGKFKLIQRVEDEEELMQGKFDSVQRVEEELLQGKFDTVQRVEEEELMQGKFDTAQLEQVPAEKANNTGLPDNLKQGIENLSGMSMDNVKVHYNSSKPAQLNALAYAQGTDIHLGSGQEKHLPHEAWHVVQQAQGRVKPTMQMKEGVPVNDDQALEHEADVMGAKAMLQKVAKSNEPDTIDNGMIDPVNDNGLQLKGVFQRKYDHLFNDIPKTLNNLDPKLKNPLVTTKIQELTAIRDKEGNGKQDFAVGEDQNSQDYGNANKEFYSLMGYYANPKLTVLPQEVRIATGKLWRESIDEPLASHLGGSVTGDVASWKGKEKPVYEALIKFRTHTSALKNQ